MICTQPRVAVRLRVALVAADRCRARRHAAGFSACLPTPALAERLMRTAWPMLWLLPTMAGTAAIAWRIAGREAALIALLLALVGLPAFHQFRPGRIDHHNVQIALTRARGRRDGMVGPRALGGRRGGRLTGLALAIGLECLPYLARLRGGLCGALRRRSRRRTGCGGLRTGAGGKHRSRRSSSSSVRSTGCAPPATRSRSTGSRWSWSAEWGWRSPARFAQRRHAGAACSACSRSARSRLRCSSRSSRAACADPTR